MLRQPVKSKRLGKQEIASSKTLVAPVKGWNTRDPEAAMAPGYAIYMDNWWPATGQVQIRQGAIDHATGLDGAVGGLFAWNGRSGPVRHKLFASTPAGIYDVTAAGPVGAAVAARTDGRCIAVNFGTTGQSYLFVVNGQDEMLRYDGSTWTSVATLPIAGGGTLDTTLIANIAIFKRRLFFIMKDSLEFYYLPIDSAGISDDVEPFPLGAVFSKGGYLMTMATWSVDGGQGVDDFAIFATSEGQVAIYAGTDPSDANVWGLQGVYDLSTPLGRKCFLKFGGDLLYISSQGVYPLTKALQSVTVTNTTAVTDVVSPTFTAYAQLYRENWGWQGAVSFVDSLMLFNVPTGEFQTSIQFAMNTKTGAWCRFVGWNAFAFETMENQLYMGMNGKVAKAWYGLNDFGGPINCYVKSAYDYLGARAREKQVRMLRPFLKFSSALNLAVAVGLDVDYQDNGEYGGNVVNPLNGALWDQALWDQAVWSDSYATVLQWVTVAAPAGYCAAIRLRVNAKDATVSWPVTDLVYEVGGIKG